MNKEERLNLFREIDIYPVISSEFTAGRNPLDILKSVANGGAGIVQLREKNMSKNDLYPLAEKYRMITSQYNMLLIVNDHLDIALACEADGVHLGQDDLPLEAAERAAPELILGNSTHSLEEAMEAQRNGAGYINIGPIFQTGTKQVSCPPLGTEILKKIIPRLEIPFTVMGGIKERHIPELLKLGVKRIAMVTEITQADDVEGKVKELRKKIHSA